MATKYNPYSDIQKVYNAKVAWNTAKTDTEKQKQNDIATAARRNLEAYGYGDVANQISASGADATAARKIMEKYAPKPVTEQGTNTSTVTPVKNTVETNNLKSAEINRENAGLFDKYNATYDDLTKTNPFTTEEAKAILAKYDLAGLQGRDNAVASGGASNGGNIDSYASANAMRQQAALVNQGQMAVLEAHKQKIDNVRGLLSDMGVNIDRVFNQDETAKNNDVARKSEIASVTGYVPTEWTYDNNIYLNKDGTVKDEFLTEEFDNTGGFTTIINNAKAKLATTTDATERANLQATINAATQAKALKTFSSPKYSKYAHEVQGVTPQITEARRESEQNDATVRETLGVNSADTRYGIDAEAKSKLDQINAQTVAEKELFKLQALMSGGDVNVFDDEQRKEVDAVVKALNDHLKTAKGKDGNLLNPDGKDLIKYVGYGKYQFANPDGVIGADGWTWEIVPIVYNSGLTADEKGMLYLQLGLNPDDVTDVYEAKGWK